MLSILIPTYNYSTFELITIIQKQCELISIAYEIIVQDDASTKLNIIKENIPINNIKHCSYLQNEINLGRVKNRISLVKKAKFEWILFLDCDVKPKNERFIYNYVEQIKRNKNKVVFGGICYDETSPNENEILRWKYGKRREEISVEERNKKPFDYLLTSNVLFHKNIFDKISFNTEITKYGYEDLVFAKELEKNNFTVAHINNPVFHLNYESSKVFLDKTEIGLETLLELEKQQVLINITKLQKTYQRLKHWKLDRVYYWFFKKWKKAIVANLLSKNPSILYLDLYKLGYFCSLKLN